MGRNGTSCRGTQFTLMHFCLSLLSPSVCCDSARNLALEASSSTRCWAQWRWSANARAAVTKTSRGSFIPKLASCLYQTGLGLHWSVRGEEKTTNFPRPIGTREEANPSIWIWIRQSYRSNTSPGSRARGCLHQPSRANKLGRSAIGCNEFIRYLTVSNIPCL